MPFGSEDQSAAVISVEAIEHALRGRDSMLWSKVGLKLVVGLPLTLIVPFAVAVLGWFWWGYFILTFLLAAAAYGYFAHRLVRRHANSSFFADAMLQEIGGDKDYAQTPYSREFEQHRNSLVAIALLDILLFGPREVIQSIDLIREHKQFTAGSLRRAAEVLQQLARHDKGIPWSDLHHQGEDPMILMRALGYLKLSDWIDTSTDGQKVWILSDARKELMRR